MTRIDQFESVFKASAKERYHFSEVSLKKALVVTDLDECETRLFTDSVRQLLRGVHDLDAIEWHEVPGERFASVQELLEIVEKERPDLVCSYRNLHSGAWRWSYSLGSYVEVLTQATSTPLLLMPNPLARKEGLVEREADDTSTVMAITNHLTGDHHLVDWAVRFTRTGGVLYLSHIEESNELERFLDVIGKIPTIETDTAREEVPAQVLKEPADYIESCRLALTEAGVDLELRAIVQMGRRLREYEALIEGHDVELLVLNTKDEDQMAMHGLAYPLVVELRHLPLLML